MKTLAIQLDKNNNPVAIMADGNEVIKLPDGTTPEEAAKAWGDYLKEYEANLHSQA